MPIPTFQFTPPQFPTNPPKPPTNPLFVATPSLLTDFLAKRKLANQSEIYSRTMQNKGFVDATFETMMKQVGWKGGDAWCAYYIKLVYLQLYSFDRQWISKNLSGSAIGNFRNIQLLNSKGDKRWIATTENEPEIGDAFSLQMPRGGHTGIITEVIKKNDDGSVTVKTIEGNTNAGASREGDKTLSLNRKMKVGTQTLGGTLLGYFKRNFTEEEKKKLKFDDKNQTFIFE